MTTERGRVDSSARGRAARRSRAGCAITANVTRPADRPLPAPCGDLSEHLGAVHLPEWVGAQLEPRAVRVAEVDRRPALLEVLDPGLVEVLLQPVPDVGLH